MVSELIWISRPGNQSLVVLRVKPSLAQARLLVLQEESSYAKPGAKQPRGSHRVPVGDPAPTTRGRPTTIRGP